MDQVSMNQEEPNGIPIMEKEEFDWLLKVDVEATISQLIQILEDCTSTFSVAPRSYNLFYSSHNQLDTIKSNITLEGCRITNADINIKLSSRHPSQTIRTCIKETPNNPFCWRLYQIQDAMNHLSNALYILKNTPLRMGPGFKHDFQTSEEVLQIIGDVMNCLQKSRSSLLIPRKLVVEELQHSQNMQSIRPALPIDFSISFYILAHNLICSVYQLSQNANGPLVKAEYQAEVSLPFLSEVLVFLSLGLQTCQQLKDKLQFFS